MQQRVERAARPPLPAAEADVHIPPRHLPALTRAHQLEEALERLLHAGADVRVEHALVVGHGLAHGLDHVVDERGYRWGEGHGDVLAQHLPRRLVQGRGLVHSLKN